MIRFKDQTLPLPNVMVQNLLYYSHLLYFSIQTLMYIGKGKFDHFTMYFNKIWKDYKKTIQICNLALLKICRFLL